MKFCPLIIIKEKRYLNKLNSEGLF